MPDPDLIDIFDRGHFHVFRKDAPEMRLTDMAHSGQFFYLEGMAGFPVNIIQGGRDNGSSAGMMRVFPGLRRDSVPAGQAYQ